MPKKLIIPPIDEPVTLGEVKDHLRIAVNDEDDFIRSLIAASREQVESFTARRLMTQTWDAYFDHFPLDSENLYIELPCTPLQSVDSVKYVDIDGALQTLDPLLYQVDAVSEPARIYAAFGKSWPSAREQHNAVVVHLVAGYGSAAAVPPTLKLAINMLVANFYENREPVSLVSRAAQPYEMPIGIQTLLTPYKMDWI